MSTVSSAQTDDRAGPKQWTALAVLALPSLLLSLDLSVLFLALPNLSADLKPSSSQLLWIGDIYGFLVAGFLITMGGIGDRIGCRKLLLIGAATFAVASVLAAYSTTALMLIAARALMGIAGATIQPCTLGLISNLFRNPKQRTVAISLWMTSFMVGLALGPLVGGVMLQFFWWGSVFLLAVPVMALLLTTAPILVPEFHNPKSGSKVDLLSVVLSLGTILPVIYGLKKVVEEGLVWSTVLPIVIGLVIGVVFVRRQRSLADPLFDLRLLSNRGVSGALGGVLFSGIAIAGVLLFFTQYLQLVKGFEPMQTGFLIIPYALGIIVGSLVSPGLAQRFRPGRVVAGGLAIGALGFLLVSQVQNVSLTLLEIGLVLAVGGAAPIYVLGTDLVVGSAPPERAGSAGSLAMTGGEVGTAMGIAVMGSVGTAVYRSQVADTMPAGVPPSAEESTLDTLAAGVEATAQLPADLGAALLSIAREAFTNAFAVVALVGAILVALMALVAWAVLRNIPSSGAPASAETPAEPTTEPAEATADAAEPTAEGAKHG